MSATGEAVTSPDMMNRRHVVVIRQKTYTQPSLRGQTESLYMMQVYQFAYIYFHDDLVLLKHL